MDQEELALVKQAQEGNSMAFDKLIRKYDKQVLSLAYSMVNNTEDAKDIYQEVCIRAYRGLKNFKFKSEFATWLYRITVNYAINFRKRRARIKTLTVELDSVGSEHWQISHDSDKTNGYTIDSELYSRLDNSLEVLSPQQRSVFVLRHYHGHKLQEIATILNCNIGTVKNYLFRATQKVRKQMEEYIEE